MPRSAKRARDVPLHTSFGENENGTIFVENEDGAMVEMNRDEVDELTDDYTCPITFDLFYDPVRMPDGKLYERVAIDEHILRNAVDGKVKSPLTNEMISVVYEPDERARRTLQKLVRSGFLTGEKAASWKQRDLQATIVRALHAKAERGDGHSMGRLGFSYRDGTRGVCRDPVKAFYWFKKAADLNDAPAATSCGVAYINGAGTAQNYMRGINMMARAAMLGSEHACLVLGWANECGHHGFDKNAEDATYWYRRSQLQPCKDSVSEYRMRAKAWIDAHDPGSA